MGVRDVWKLLVIVEESDEILDDVTPPAVSNGVVFARSACPNEANR
jgi:hypothetical protein